MVELKYPRHVVVRVERRWAQKLEAQAQAWKAAKPNVDGMTDRGVQVLRRRKRPRPMKSAVV
jgi:hypothetical protein